MRISKKAEYALRALTAFARKPKSWSIQDLSVKENIPIKFLEQILLALRNAGLLASKRGVGGGYTLLKPASEISVGEVLRILDGPIAPVACAVDRPSEQCTCPNPRSCPLRHFMKRFRQELCERLESQTIEEMLRQAPNPEALAFEI